MPVKIVNARSVSYAVAFLVLLLLPQLLSLFATKVIAEYHLMQVEAGLIMAIMALGLNLLLRYTGVLSFGHGAYFAVGAYGVGLLQRWFFPDAAVSLELAILSSLGVSLFISAIFGYICVRHTRIFFSILTLALAMLVFAVLEKAYNYTGGSDGIRVLVPTIFGQELDMRRPEFLAGIYYYVVLGIFSVATLVMLAIVNSPFGKALQATRDNELRAEMVGIRVKLFRWYAFVISGVFAGLAGGLSSFATGHITPELSHWVFSGEAVYMVLLGGFTIFEGPIIGAVLFHYLLLYTSANTEYWMLYLGGVLIVLVLFLPRGITGGLASLIDLFRRKTPTADHAARAGE